MPKIFTLYIKKAIQKQISKKQCTYLSGHSNSNNAIFAQETIYSLHSAFSLNPLMAIKLDIEKIYNIFNQIYLETVLPHFLFIVVLIHQIKGHVICPSLAILVSRSLAIFFLKKVVSEI